MSVQVKTPGSTSSALNLNADSAGINLTLGKDGILTVEAWQRAHLILSRLPTTVKNEAAIEGKHMGARPRIARLRASKYYLSYHEAG